MLSNFLCGDDDENTGTIYTCRQSRPQRGLQHRALLSRLPKYVLDLKKELVTEEFWVLIHVAHQISYILSRLILSKTEEF